MLLEKDFVKLECNTINIIFRKRDSLYTILLCPFTLTQMVRYSTQILQNLAANTLMVQPLVKAGMVTPLVLYIYNINGATVGEGRDGYTTGTVYITH